MPSRAEKRDSGGIELRSTARADCEIEVNSGRLANGVAIIVTSVSVMNPTRAKLQLKTFSGNRTIHFDMIGS